MIQIRCPCCDELRIEDELTYGGEAYLTRPAETCSDDEWTDYLFMRTNRRGGHRELWCCSSGCGQWFEVSRDTVTHTIESVRSLEPAPRRRENIA
jgi:sarcosine oxidase subunit delta